MKIPYSILQSFFEERLPAPIDLYDIFTFGLCEIESMEHVQTVSGSDTIFDLKVLPDRAPYLLSWWGIAYETSALLGIPLKFASQTGTFGIPGHSIGNVKLPEIVVNDSIQSPKVVIEDSASCSGYMSRKIQNIKGAKSPVWLVNSLESVGQRSISPVVDLTNYVMFMTGQPLHAFDADLIKGPIVIRKAKESESMQTLDAKNVKLNEKLCVVADSENILNLAGVKGGKIPEITSKTENIILESAHFDPAYVRFASAQTGIFTDASKRFENNVPEEQVKIAFNMFSSLFSLLAPKAEFGPATGFIPSPQKSVAIPVHASHVSSVLGIPLTAPLCAGALTRLGIVTQKDKGDWYTLTPIHLFESAPDFYALPPYWRKDLNIQEDLVEEIGRIIGYDSIPPTLPPITGHSLLSHSVDLSGSVSASPEFYYSSRIRETLATCGFSEVITYTLGKDGYYETAKPLAEDKAKLRQSLLPNFKKSLEMNVKNSDILEVDEIRQFEIGRVFTKDAEELRIALGVAFPKKIKGKTPVDRIVSAYETVSKMVGVNLLSAKQVETSPKEDMKTGADKAKPGTDSGNLGVPTSLSALSDSIVSQGLFAWAEFTLPVKILESQPINVPALTLKDLAPIKREEGVNAGEGASLRKTLKEKKYKKISPYPYAVRDIAVFVKSDDPTATKESLEELIRENAGEYLVSLRLFDVYVQPSAVNEANPGNSINVGKTSYAFRLIFQAQDKTLVEDEIVKPMDAVYSALKGKGYEIR